MKTLVTGAGGFIGHWLVNSLANKGMKVRGVDIKDPEYEPTRAVEWLRLDLRNFESCMIAVHGCDYVFHLAADMGGIGYITANHAGLTRNNTLMDVNMLEAARLAKVRGFLYTSSACVYAAKHQKRPDITGLRESDAIPAEPEKGYGWEKLYAEQLATYYHEEYGLSIRLPRLHNIYGPLGTWIGGKEKAPAAICRKVAVAEDGGKIEIWGDGKQTRSFCWIEDCVEALRRMMFSSDFKKPINLGTEELVTVDQLVDLVCEIAGKKLTKKHNLARPQGVRGRNSDNALLRKVLGWEPTTRLADGLKVLYPWIEGQVRRS